MALNWRPPAPGALIWPEDALGHWGKAERAWLSQQLAWTFSGASGFFGKRPRTPQSPCLPPLARLCQA